MYWHFYLSMFQLNYLKVSFLISDWSRNFSLTFDLNVQNLIFLLSYFKQLNLLWNHLIYGLIKSSFFKSLSRILFVYYLFQIQNKNNIMFIYFVRKWDLSKSFKIHCEKIENGNRSKVSNSILAFFYYIYITIFA